MRKRVVVFFMIAVSIVALLGTFIFFKPLQFRQKIPVGILQSLTGPLGISGTESANAALLAIEEINNAGGVLGRKLEPILVDGKSDWPTFAAEAKKLIVDKKAAVIFGCWSSASRKAVKPVVEKYKHLLFYAVQYEGLESSPNIAYTGATPNQRIMPGVAWCYNTFGKSFFLIGSDSVFSRVANEIIKDLVLSLGGQVVGEDYIALGGKTSTESVQKIIDSKAAVIINTLSGDSNIAFFKALRAGGITPEKVPTMSFNIAEPELKHLDIDTMVGDYIASNYFQSLSSPSNDQFVKKYKAKYDDAVISAPMEASYFGVHLWAQAVRRAGTVDVEKVKEALKGSSYDAPEGVITMDSNLHTWKFIRIAKIQSTGQCNIIWYGEKTVKPEVYPTQFRTQGEWDAFLDTLYKGWGNQWSARK
jgi:urea transport system substrate-binding protein